MPREPQAAPTLAAPAQSGAPSGASGAEDFLDALVGDGVTAPPVTQEPEPIAPETEPIAPEPVQTAPEPAPVEQNAPAVPGIPQDVLPATEPEAAPAAAPLDDADIPDPPDIQGDPKANDAWQRVKRERREFRDSLKEAQTELERMRSDVLPEQGELQELRDQVKDYENKIGQYDLSATQSFKRTFDEPLKDLRRRATSLLARSGRDPEDAAKLVDNLMDLAKTGDFNYDDVQDMLAGEALPTQGALTTAVNDYADLAKKRQTALDHFQDTRAALEETESRTEEFQLTQDIERDSQIALTSVLEDGNWMFAQSPSDPNWNEGVAQRISAAKGIIRSAEPSELVKYVMEGVSAKATRELLIAESTRANKLKTELDGMVAVTPSIGGHSTQSSAPRTLDQAPRDATDFISEHLSDLNPAVVGR